jgi:hypothetical protein
MQGGVTRGQADPVRILPHVRLAPVGCERLGDEETPRTMLAATAGVHRSLLGGRSDHISDRGHFGVDADKRDSGMVRVTPVLYISQVSRSER